MSTFYKNNISNYTEKFPPFFVFSIAFLPSTQTLSDCTEKSFYSTSLSYIYILHCWDYKFVGVHVSQPCLALLTFTFRPKRSERQE